MSLNKTKSHQNDRREGNRNSTRKQNNPDVPTPSEPPNGPGHLGLYRKIQAAGKIVHIQVSKENIMPLLKELNPALLMLQTHCSDVAEGEALLEAVKY